MLSSLTIKDIILIDHLVIEFKEGLCALTGETGAGKSILLDSLGLALGVRGQSGLVRKGAKQASVTAAFHIPEDHAAHKIMAEYGISGDDDMLLMRRVLNASGTSRAFINDQPVSVSLLRQVGECLVEIHGQFETHGLLNPQTHRRMLDDYARIDHNVAALWESWKDEEDILEEMSALSTRSHHEEEYWKTALEDLEALDPKVGEEGELLSLRTRLKHKETVLEALNRANMFLSGDHDPVQGALREIERVADKMGEEAEKPIEALAHAVSEIQEALAHIHGLSADMQEEGSCIEDIDDRLYALRAQARKFKCAVEDLPDKKEEIEQNLRLITHADESLEQQKEKVRNARENYIQAAQTLSKQRQKEAVKLNALVQEQLAPLKLEKAKFVAHVEQTDEVEWGAQGMDRVRFLVSTNPGRAAGPIHKIASGGEMSRFMLALKVVIAQDGSTHSFIFDEVDSGLGGSTADAVGERLSILAQSKQVLVVTHAPQVAARADHHWIVQKEGAEENITTIVPLDTRQKRCEEIARMLAGAKVTSEARAAADKLLESAA